MEVETIGVRELQTYLEYNNVMIVDVRDKNDYDKHHIKGAINIPYEKLDSTETLLDRKKMIIFYCERGSRSLLATKKMMLKGYFAKSLIGGIQGYFNQYMD